MIIIDLLNGLRDEENKNENIETKECIKCHEKKHSIEGFYGKKSMCKKCEGVYLKNRRIAQGESALIKKREQYKIRVEKEKQNPNYERRSKRAAYLQQYEKDNKERIKERRKRKKQKNKEQRDLLNKKIEENPNIQIELKECSICHENKKVNEFELGRAQCKSCHSEKLRVFRMENKEIIRKRNKEQWEKNGYKYKEKHKEYCETNKEQLYLKRLEYEKANRLLRNAKKRHYNKRNRKKVNDLQIKWRNENKEYVSNYRKEYYKERMQNDLEFKLCRNIRGRIRVAVANNRQTSSANLIGCSIEEVRKHLESRFYSKIDENGNEIKMSWDNYGHGKGFWEIDHTIPCKYFDMEKLEEQMKCFNFKNCSPMWSEENNSKNDIFPESGLRAKDQRILDSLTGFDRWAKLVEDYNSSNTSNNTSEICENLL